MYFFFSISYLTASSSLDESNNFVLPYWQPKKNSINRFISRWGQRLHPSILVRSSYWRFFASSVCHRLWGHFQSHTFSLFLDMRIPLYMNWIPQHRKFAQSHNCCVEIILLHRQRTQLTIFCITSRDRVISHCFTPKIKGHMVQTWSMTSINPEIGNPPTAIEKQLQTLSTANERLT